MFSVAAGRYGIPRNDDLDSSQANYLLTRQAGETYKDRCKKSSKYGKIRIPPICRCACPPKTKAQGKLCVSDGDKSELSPWEAEERQERIYR